MDASSCSHITAAFSNVTRKLSNFKARRTMDLCLLKMYHDNVGSTITCGKMRSVSETFKSHTISVAILIHRFQIWRAVGGVWMSHGSSRKSSCMTISRPPQATKAIRGNVEMLWVETVLLWLLPSKRRCAIRTRTFLMRLASWAWMASCRSRSAGEGSDDAFALYFSKKNPVSKKRGYYFDKKLFQCQDMLYRVTIMVKKAHIFPHNRIHKFQNYISNTSFTLTTPQIPLTIWPLKVKGRGPD